MMSHELSYKQLKTANDVRVNEEIRLEQRKRNLLLLILHYLEDQGYLDSVQSLETEAGVSLKKFQICDNIDLETILQEYESYFYVKFNKWPKITKRAQSSDENGRTKNSASLKKPSLAKKKSDFSLPEIPSPTHKLESPSRKSSSAKQKPTHKDCQKTSKSSSTKDSQEQNNIQRRTSDEGISLSGSSISQKDDQFSRGNKHGKKTIIDFKAILSNSLKGECTTDIAPEERLLKPLAGYAGLTGEYRELAAVITRDIYLENPNVYWNDIIGLNEPKRLIKEAVVYPIKYPKLFTGILSPWKGLLLYGPPGTGKTLLAKAVATECNTTFFNISASTVVSKWRGDSEKLIRVLFDLARFHAPSTIFLDELDSLMSQRGSSGSSEHEGSRRMKTELLVQMDGLSKSDDLVFLLAASNLPWELDHAMLRRLEKRILVDLPTKDARVGIIKHFLPPGQSNENSNSPVTNAIDYEHIAGKTEGYSGSDLRLLCKEAAMRPMRKIFDALEQLSSDDAGAMNIKMEDVTTEDAEEALKRTKPSANSIKDKYEKWKEEFESV